MTRRWRQALGVLWAATVLGCRDKKPAEESLRSSAPKPVSVTVAPIERRTVERTVDVVGTLKGWEEVTVGAKRMGRVVRVLHDVGDRVRPGEPLVELDRTDDDAAVLHAEQSLIAMLEQVGLHKMPDAKIDRPGIPVVEQAKAEIEKARNGFDVSNVPAVVQARFALEKARQNFARERSLRQRGAGTPQDYQNAEIDEHAAEAAQANAELAARGIFANAIVSRIALEMRKVQREDMTIRVPFPRHLMGEHRETILYAVTKRSAAEGQMLKEGEAVADLVIEDPLRLWTNVPEQFAAEVKVGQDVRISVTAYAGKAFLGKVARINPAVDATSRTFQVETAIPNPDGKLRPGGFAKAAIVVKRDDQAATVPIESVVRSVGITKVFVTDGTKARAVPVETGLEGKGWVEVIGALPSQAMVVTTGQSQLADDVPVTIRAPKAAPAPVPAAKTAEAVSQAGPGG
jgi:multidrug efflux pump subunit AcrA (membrane-fusion protein)